jgi:hypothetical protein
MPPTFGVGAAEPMVKEPLLLPVCPTDETTIIGRRRTLARTKICMLSDNEMPSATVALTDSW